MLLLAQCAVIIYLRSDSEWAFVTVGLIVFIFLGFAHHWAYGVKKAMPELAVHMYPTLLMASFGSPFIVRWFFTCECEQADEAAGMTSPPRDDEDPDTTS